MAVKVELTVAGCPQREAFYDLRAAVPLAEHVASLFRTFFPAASLAAPSRQRSGADGAPGSGEREQLWAVGADARPLPRRRGVGDGAAAAPLLGGRGRDAAVQDVAGVHRRRRAVHAQARRGGPREGGVLRAAHLADGPAARRGVCRPGRRGRADPPGGRRREAVAPGVRAAGAAHRALVRDRHPAAPPRRRRRQARAALLGRRRHRQGGRDRARDPLHAVRPRRRLQDRPLRHALRRARARRAELPAAARAHRRVRRFGGEDERADAAQPADPVGARPQGEGAAPPQALAAPRRRPPPLEPAPPAGARLPPAAPRVPAGGGDADPGLVGAGRPLPPQVPADGRRAAGGARGAAGLRDEATDGEDAPARARQHARGRSPRGCAGRPRAVRVDRAAPRRRAPRFGRRGPGARRRAGVGVLARARRRAGVAGPARSVGDEVAAAAGAPGRSTGATQHRARRAAGGGRALWPRARRRRHGRRRRRRWWRRAWRLRRRRRRRRAGSGAQRRRTQPAQRRRRRAGRWRRDGTSGARGRAPRRRRRRRRPARPARGRRPARRCCRRSRSRRSRQCSLR